MAGSWPTCSKQAHRKGLGNGRGVCGWRERGGRNCGGHFARACAHLALEALGVKQPALAHHELGLRGLEDRLGAVHGGGVLNINHCAAMGSRAEGEQQVRKRMRLAAAPEPQQPGPRPAQPLRAGTRKACLLPGAGAAGGPRPGPSERALQSPRCSGARRSLPREPEAACPPWSTVAGLAANSATAARARAALCGRVLTQALVVNEAAVAPGGDGAERLREREASRVHGLAVLGQRLERLGGGHFRKARSAGRVARRRCKVGPVGARLGPPDLAFLQPTSRGSPR